MSLLGPKEKARVEKTDGKVLGPYDAIFAGGTIVITDPMADLESGDTILRRLPNGKDERFVIAEATFYNQRGGSLGAHYQVKFRKGGEGPSKPPNQSISITGAQSVQIGDYNTQSIVGSFEALVKLIDSSTAPPREKAEAKSLLSTLLRHPLVVSLIGTAAGALMSR